MNRDRPRDTSRMLIASLAALTFSLPQMFAAAIKARMQPAPRLPNIAGIPRSRGRPKSNVDLGCYPKKPHSREWIGKGRTRRLVFVPTCEPSVHVRRDGAWKVLTQAQFAALNPLGLQARGTIVEHVNSFGQVTRRERVPA